MDFEVIKKYLSGQIVLDYEDIEAMNLNEYFGKNKIPFVIVLDGDANKTIDNSFKLFSAENNFPKDFDIIVYIKSTYPKWYCVLRKFYNCNELLINDIKNYLIKERYYIYPFFDIFINALDESLEFELSEEIKEIWRL